MSKLIQSWGYGKATQPKHLKAKVPSSGGGGAGPFSFSPADLSGLELWCQFNSGITVTGAGVSQWDDQSGNDNHLKQGTDTNRPSKESDGSILFDGVDNYLKADAFTLVQPETVYILFKQVSWTSNDSIYDGNLGTTGVLAQLGTVPELIIIAGVLLSNNSDLSLGVYGVVSVIFNSTSSLLQVDNGTPLIGNAGGNDMGGFTLGSTATGTSPANIQVKEVLIYSAAHDADTRTQVRDYLNTL